MKIQLRWKDCDRSKAVESTVIKSVESLSKYSFVQEKAKVEIVYYKKNQTYKTRINIDVKGGKIIRAEASANTIYGATNSAVDKIEDQLRRIKTKFIKK